MVPTIRGYKGAPTLVSAGYSALPAECTGATLAFKLDGSTRIIAGTQGGLYEASGTSWTDVSKSGGYTTGDVRWRFAQFGDTTLAINKATQLQQSSSGAFATVSNSPKASLIETVGAFVMLADTDDSGLSITGGPNADQGHRWWCSAAFSPTSTWAPSSSTQATTGLLVGSPGKIVALKRLGASVVAYKNRSFYIGYPTDPPEVFKFVQGDGDVGAVGNEAVVSIRSAHLFVGTDDIYRLDNNSTTPVSIGLDVREWFFARLNKSYSYLIVGLHDYNNSCVWWWYPSGTNTVLDSVLIYNYKTETWGALSDDTSLAPVSRGVTVDQDPFWDSVISLVQSGAGSEVTDQSPYVKTAAINADAAWDDTTTIFGASGLHVTRNFADIDPFEATGVGNIFTRASGEAYTIEMWFRWEAGALQNVTTSAQLFQIYGGANILSVQLYSTGGQLAYYQTTDPQTVDASSTTADTWHFLQVTMQEDDSMTLDIDGVEIDSTSAPVNSSSTSYLFLGDQSGATSGSSSSYWIGPFRITKGVARTRGSIPTDLFPTS